VLSAGLYSVTSFLGGFLQKQLKVLLNNVLHGKRTTARGKVKHVPSLFGVRCCTIQRTRHSTKVLSNDSRGVLIQ
jgi:hypothetical protein